MDALMSGLDASRRFYFAFGSFPNGNSRLTTSRPPLRAQIDPASASPATASLANALECINNLTRVRHISDAASSVTLPSGVRTPINLFFT